MSGSSSWQGIAALREYPDLLHEVLDGVISGEILPTTVKKTCEQMKQIGLTRDMVVAAMKVSTWEEVVQKWPCFLVKENFEQILKSGKSGELPCEIVR